LRTQTGPLRVSIQFKTGHEGSNPASAGVGVLAPQFEEQAAYLARERLAVAAMRIALGRIELPQKEVRAG